MGMNEFHLRSGMEQRKLHTSSQTRRGPEKVVLARLCVGGRLQEYKADGGFGAAGLEKEKCAKQRAVASWLTVMGVYVPVPKRSGSVKTSTPCPTCPCPLKA